MSESDADLAPAPPTIKQGGTLVTYNEKLATHISKLLRIRSVSCLRPIITLGTLNVIPSVDKIQSTLSKKYYSLLLKMMSVASPYTTNIILNLPGRLHPPRW